MAGKSDKMMEKGRQFTGHGAAQDTGRAPDRFAVIVPAHNASATLDACLEALGVAGFAPAEILVVDDGSRDDTGEIARQRGIRVIRNETALRPAKARNRGVAETESEILVFVDSDVVVHPGLRAALRTHFANPDRTGVIGSYDDAPAAPSVVSRYRNLLHHITHQDSAGEVPTFWSGLGALRRDAFVAAGGFDSAWEDIEDVELGLRVTAAGGRIALDPTIQGKHLKDWTVRSMVRTDIYGRAVPWTRLMMAGRLRAGALNTSALHRTAVLMVAAVPLTLALSVVWDAALILSALYAAVFLAVTSPVAWRLARAGGALFALRAMPYHILHYVAALIGYTRARLFEKGTA